MLLFGKCKVLWTVPRTDTGFISTFTVSSSDWYVVPPSSFVSPIYIYIYIDRHTHPILHQIPEPFIGRWDIIDCFYHILFNIYSSNLVIQLVFVSFCYCHDNMTSKLLSSHTCFSMATVVLKWTKLPYVQQNIHPYPPDVFGIHLLLYDRPCCYATNCMMGQSVNHV